MSYRSRSISKIRDACCWARLLGLVALLVILHALGISLVVILCRLFSFFVQPNQQYSGRGHYVVAVSTDSMDLLEH